MKRLIPNSLAGQLLLLVAIMLLIAQGINMLLLYRGAQNQNLAAAASTAIGRIASDLDQVDRLERSERRNNPRLGRGRPMTSDNSIVGTRDPRAAELESRAAEALVNMGFDVRSVEIALVQRLPETLSRDVVLNRMAPPRRGQMDRIMGRDRGNGSVTGYLLISVKTSNGNWTSIASAVRDRNQGLVWPLLLQTIILYLILLVPLILLGRYVSKPLNSLTGSVETFRPDGNTAVAEAGPPDVRRLIAAFNDMNERVGTMLNEKDVMLGAIGHDLRTPLAALRVRVESVENDAERAQMIAGIEDMDMMLEDILSLARVGRSAEAPQNTDVSALIETVVSEFLDLGKDVTFERSGRIAATLKATLIRRALRNLIGNAVKYAGTARLSVDSGVDKLMIHVDDDGPGIATDEIDAMFEPFVRAEQSRNRKTGGSGLGLTLARAIARDHGGDVVLKNRSEGGLRASLIINTA